MKQAVRGGFNQFKTPGIDMSLAGGIGSLFGLSAQQMFQDWRQRLMTDTTDWGLCSVCVKAFHQSRR